MNLPILEEVVRDLIPPFSQATDVVVTAEEVVGRVWTDSAALPRIIQTASTNAAATAREARMFGKIGSFIEFCLSKTRSIGAVIPRNCWWIGGGALTLIVGGLFFSSCLRRDVIDTTVLPNPNEEDRPTNIIYTPFQLPPYGPTGCGYIPNSPLPYNPGECSSGRWIREHRREFEIPVEEPPKDPKSDKDPDGRRGSSPAPVIPNPPVPRGPRNPPLTSGEARPIEPPQRTDLPPAQIIRRKIKEPVE